MWGTFIMFLNFSVPLWVVCVLCVVVFITAFYCGFLIACMMNISKDK